MTDRIVVFSTCGTFDEAERIARHLVNQRLAACVQIDAAVQSFYHWQGKLERSEEFRLTIKSRRDLFDALCGELRSLHSYEVPEIVALPVVNGAASYLEWMDKELQPPRNL
jgi:periplasmic divalent cation tolerance protein